MNRKNIIVVIVPGKDPETWGNFKKVCEAKGLPYHTLKDKKFPIIYKEYAIYRVPFN